MARMVLLRPADAAETAMAWKLALERRDGPVLLVLTRQKLPTLDRDTYAPAEGLLKGGYVLADSPTETLDVILIGTGSEVHVALEARAQLEAEGIGARVVSLPSWELFSEQEQKYRDEVLPPGTAARVAVEAASPFGWERWVGERGAIVGIDRFGASAPGGLALAKLGITPEHVVQAARSVMG